MSTMAKIITFVCWLIVGIIGDDCLNELNILDVKLDINVSSTAIEYDLLTNNIYIIGGELYSDGMTIEYNDNIKSINILSKEINNHNLSYMNSSEFGLHYQGYTINNNILYFFTSYYIWDFNKLNGKIRQYSTELVSVDHGCLTSLNNEFYVTFDDKYYKYNTNQMWNELISLPVSHVNSGCVIFNGSTLYIIGGQTRMINYILLSSNIVWNNSSSELMKPIQYNRLVIVNELIYNIGGYYEENGLNIYIDYIEIYNPITDTISNSVVSLPYSLSATSVIIIDNVLYILNGYIDDDNGSTNQIIISNNLTCQSEPNTNPDNNDPKHHHILRDILIVIGGSIIGVACILCTAYICMVTETKRDKEWKEKVARKRIELQQEQIKKNAEIERKRELAKKRRRALNKIPSGSLNSAQIQAITGGHNNSNPLTTVLNDDENDIDDAQLLDAITPKDPATPTNDTQSTKKKKKNNKKYSQIPSSMDDNQD